MTDATPTAKDEDWVGAVRGRFYRPAKQNTAQEDNGVSLGLNNAKLKANGGSA